MPTTTAPSEPPVHPTARPSTLTVRLGQLDSTHPVQFLDGIAAVDAWLPHLGPSAVMLLSRLVRTGPCTWNVVELGRTLGLTAAHTWRTFDRLRHFGFVAGDFGFHDDDGIVTVVCSTPPARPRGQR